MSLKTKVKVGNITNLSEARYCAGMGVDMLGFKIGENNGQISPDKFRKITEWISGPEFVLEFADGLPDQALEKNNVTLAELHYSEISKLNFLKSGQHCIITIDLKEWKQNQSDLLKYIDSIKYLLVTNSHALTFLELKGIVVEMANHFDVLLGVDVNIGLLDDYLSWPIAGLALNGSEETSPGIKDYDHLSSILERLEVD